MDLILCIGPLCEQGGEGVQKPKNFADVIQVLSFSSYILGILRI